MHIHLPKPLHGWRAFVGEIAVIVLGILIALTAEHLVEQHRWNREVAETRHAADAEIAHDFGVFEYRVAQKACVDRRVAELERWMQSWRDKRPVALKGPIGSPPGFGIHFSVWDAASGEARAHMPLDEKLTYAGLYDVLKSYNQQRNSEREAWTTLADYDGVADLTREDLIRIRGLVSRIKAFNTTLPGFAPYVRKPAAKLGIKADLGPVPEVARKLNAEFCKPAL